MHRREIAWAMSLIMTAGLLQVTAPPVQAAVGDNEPAAQKSRPAAPARPAPSVRPRKADPRGRLAATPPTVTWPKAGRADFVLGTRTPVKGTVGGVAVTVMPAATRAATATKAAAGAATAVPVTVRVETLDRAASERAGVTGPVLKVSRADGAAGPAQAVTMSVDYRGFAGAYGGDFGARLRMVRLPDCALVTPGQAACAPRAVSTVNDTEDGSVSAQVTAGPAPTLFALAAQEASAQGNYGATSLAPSAKWSVAPSSGGYNWDYPITVPPVPGGQVPAISLGYNSQSIDGRTATTNNQGSWIGEGFGYEPGYVERQYKTCRDDGHETSGDNCWAYDNATIMLNGKSNTLVRTGSTWRFGSDDGSTIERVTGATNDDNDGESWVVTTTDGTKYYFGLNRLPGWTATKEETRSTWTVPVFGDDKTNAEDAKANGGVDKPEPCYQESFAKAFCQQAWRWNLDYVKDVHGNVVSYFYEKEINAYALGGKLDVNGTPYTRGGYLKRIDYGQRAGAVYSTNAPARVVFDTLERCLPGGGVTCGPGDLKESTALNWQDTPFDRICAADTKCKMTQTVPSFFTRRRLTGITAQIRSGTDWAPVNGWTFDHIFTNNGDGSRSLWLSKITHSGYGGIRNTTPLTLPSVELLPLQLPNRIDIPNDNVSELVRPRLSTVYTESGAQVDVSYEDPDCSAGALPTVGKSTRRCYPVKWSPGGEVKPITDWFHKYVVKEVIETDRTGGAPDQVTRYDYRGDAGWRYADATGLSKDEGDYLSWSQWRGYAKVVVTEGDGQAMTTKSEHTYLRGLDGDKDPDGGTRAVTREDSTGATYRDTDQLAGFEIETAVYDGATVITKTITKPRVQQVATVQHPWGTDNASFVQPEVVRGFSLLANGKWRETKSVTTYDPKIGRVTRVEDFGDVSTTEDDQCTRSEYADNPSLGILNLISRKETVAVNCTATVNRATEVLADERTYYDSKSLGAAPDPGNPTRTESIASHDGKVATYFVDGESLFDEYGRPKLTKDGAGTATTITYTQVDGLTTKKVETGPLGTVTTEYATPWAQPTAQIDLNSKRTDLGYDKLGRLIKVLMPNRPRTDAATLKYTYSFVRDQPVFVKTEKLRNDGTYRSEFQIYDGFLRPRQIQSEGPRGGRLVADNFYTPTGKLAQTNDTYYAAGAPSGAILPSRNGDVDGQTQFIYDGADRVTDTITLRAGDERWRTVTTYEGADQVSVTPPSGGTATTKILDARGQTRKLLQYKGPKPVGEADTTSYTYTPAGKLSTVTDPADNTWKHFYDVRGREIATEDPDTGRTTSTYDKLDRLETTEDSRDITLTTTYDAVGRKTALYHGDTLTGTKLSSWTYDAVAKGQLYASTRYVNGARYEVRYPVLDALYRPLVTEHVFPKADAGQTLGGVYSSSVTYHTDGTVQGVGFSAAGGLEAESVAYMYDDVDGGHDNENLRQVRRIVGKDTYATNMAYAPTGELLKAELSTGGRKAWATATYEQGTKRLIGAGVVRQAIITPGGPPDPTPVNDVDQKFTYDDAGNVLSMRTRRRPASVISNASGTTTCAG
ncbi:MAG TPA: hypothetical protein VF657_04125 [Actinoplanes sp.]